jgi:hypothetical protein
LRPSADLYDPVVDGDQARAFSSDQLASCHPVDSWQIDQPPPQAGSRGVRAIAFFVGLPEVHSLGDATYEGIELAGLQIQDLQRRPSGDADSQQGDCDDILACESLGRLAAITAASEALELASRVVARVEVLVQMADGLLRRDGS